MTDERMYELWQETPNIDALGFGFILLKEFNKILEEKENEE